MSLTIYPSSGCGCCPGSYFGVHKDDCCCGGGRRRNRYGRGYGFDTCCALFQRSADGYIYTGPITFNDPGIAGLTITALPASAGAVFVNAAGTVIDSPVNDEPFFVRVEDTDSTVLIRLFAGIPEPAEDTTDDVLGEMLSMSCMAPEAPYDPSWDDEDPEDVFGEGFIFYDILRFYINPQPTNCRRNRNCVNLPNGSYDDESGEQLPFFGGCCRNNCGCYHHYHHNCHCGR